MGKSMSLGVSATARQGKAAWIGDADKKARKIKAGWIGVNGVARLFYQSLVKLFATDSFYRNNSNSNRREETLLSPSDGYACMIFDPHESFASFTKATLHMYVTTIGTFRVSARIGTMSNPDYTTSIGDYITVTPSATGWIEVDITEKVQTVLAEHPDLPTAGLKIFLRKGNARISSHTGDNPPYMILESGKTTPSEPSAGYVNRVPLSIDTDGSIYNSTGYKSGYRIRSGGAEGEMENATCTGFIRVSPGDVIRFSGWDVLAANVSGAVNSINVADGSFANIGQTTSQPADYGIFAQSAYAGYRFSSVVEEKAGVYKWIVPPAASGAAYIRITAAAVGLSGADMIVTINEEIA